MRAFGRAGIAMNGQIVVCPGWNDGTQLQRTMEDMDDMGFVSCSVVPVGLTKYRQGLSKLRPVTQEEARAIIAMVEAFGEKCLARHGERRFFCSDELYLRAVNSEITFQEAAGHPKGAGLTSFLGMGQLKYVDLPAQAVEVRRGDQFILMSDGVYNALTEEELKAALDAGGADALRTAIQAKGYTNQDNYTAVIVTC